MNLINLFIGRAHAATNLNLNSFDFLQTPTNLTAGTLITFVINLILIIAALAAFIYLIIAGFQYITAGGDAEKATKARTGIINTIIGIIVIVLAYAVVHYIGTLFSTGVPSGIN